MVVRQQQLGLLAQAELVQRLVVEQGLVVGPVLVGGGTRNDAAAAAKDALLGRVDAGAQLVPFALEHELVQLCRALGVLLNLLAGFGVKDGQAGVDVPLLAVDSQHNVDLDVLDAANVAGRLPRVLLHAVPGLAHGEKGRVSDGLRVGCDMVVLLGRQVDMSALKASQDSLNFLERLLRSTMLDQNLQIHDESIYA